MRHALLLSSAFGIVSATPALTADVVSPPLAPDINLGTNGNMSLPDLDVVAKRLDEARSQIEPNLGATRFDFSRQGIETTPQGDNAPLNQVLLQAPGVAQDSFGQIHVRGDHNEVQYRLDGVQLPEGLSVFGQALETRFAHSISLITGSLPAQYGFLQAGVVDITTKSGTTDPGGEISIYGGMRDLFQPSFSYGGRSGAIDYFITGDFLHTRIGIENPTSSFNAIHDLSNQYHGLLHVSGIVDPTTRISFIAGVSNDVFQIPNNPNQTPTLGLTVNGISDFNSASLTEHQREITDFGILSLQKHIDTVDIQISAFSRYTSLYFTPDPLGDLLYNGISQTAARSVWSTGAQTDASWRVNDSHTVRAGFQGSGERTVAATESQVLLTDDSGAPVSDVPSTVYGSLGKTGGLYGVYVQDEWRVLPRVTLNYGARFDGVDEFTQENQISPRINVVWKATDTTTAHAGYSRYFTPPPFELVSGSTLSLFNNTTAAPATNQNTTVKAERDHYFDAGVTQILLPGLTAGVDAYYKQAKNLIDEGQFGAPIIETAFNYAKGQVWGVEGTTSYDRGPWSLYGNVAFSRAIGRDITSSQFNFTADDLAYISHHYIYLDHDQRWTGSVGAAYTLFKETRSPARLSADLLVGSGLRASTPTVPNGRELPSYYTINLSAVQTLNVGYLHGTQLRLDVINLLDQKYEIRDGTGVGVGAPQFGLRRAILGGIAQRF
ncbi:TonB-dependent receptor [Rhodopila sp.]|uniref:TonB-dependent receptor n=1 Tax=Rhodopila sp. TaxID=2480087 RepID=UPI003D0A8EC5